MSEINLFPDYLKAQRHPQMFEAPAQKMMRTPETNYRTSCWSCLPSPSQGLDQLFSAISLILNKISNILGSIWGKDSMEASPEQSPERQGLIPGPQSAPQNTTAKIIERVQGWAEKGPAIIEGVRELWSKGREIFGSFGESLAGGLESASPFVSNLPGRFGKIGSKILSAGLNLIKKIF
jgi:hypothetical protein